VTVTSNSRFMIPMYLHLHVILPDMALNTFIRANHCKISSDHGCYSYSGACLWGSRKGSGGCSSCSRVHFSRRLIWAHAVRLSVLMLWDSMIH